MRQTQEFKIPQEVLLSETSFGQQYWSGPGIVVKVEARKACVRFGNKENDQPQNQNQSSASKVVPFVDSTNKI